MFDGFQILSNKPNTIKHDQTAPNKVAKRWNVWSPNNVWRCLVPKHFPFGQASTPFVLTKVLIITRRCYKRVCTHLRGIVLSLFPPLLPVLETFSFKGGITAVLNCAQPKLKQNALTSVLLCGSVGRRQRFCRLPVAHLAMSATWLIVHPLVLKYTLS